MAAHGFGRGPFGEGPFGESRWGYEVFWSSLPAAHRLADKANDDYLQKFMLSLADVSDRLRRDARDWPEQKDPRRSRTRFNRTMQIVIDAPSAEFISAADSDDGRAYISLLYTSVIPSDDTFAIGVDLVFPGWVLEAGNRTYPVRFIDKNGTELQVYGDVTDGVPTGTLTLRPPSMIARLGYEYDVRVDGYEPEYFQRSTVYDSVKWYNLKGTANGFVLRGLVAGFDVTVVKLYRISGDWTDWLGPSHVFEIPDGSGNFYTDYAPKFYRYDDIHADVIPLDQHCETYTPPLWSMNVTTVTPGTGSGEYLLDGSFTTDNPISGGPWVITEDADPTRAYHIENASDYRDVVGPPFGGGGFTAMSVISLDQAPATGTYTLTYDCQIEMSCDWCQSHKVEVILVPTALLTPASLEGAFDRLLRKLEELVPAHVELVRIVFTESASAELELSALPVSQSLVFALFDDDAADVHPVDDFTIVPH